MPSKTLCSATVLVASIAATTAAARMGAGRVKAQPAPSVAASGQDDVRAGVAGLPQCDSPLGAAVVEQRSQAPAVWNALDMYGMGNVIEAMLDTSGCFTVVKDEGQADYRVLAIAVPPSLYDEQPAQIELSDVAKAIKTVEASGYVMRSRGALGAQRKVDVPFTVDLRRASAFAFDEERVAALVQVTDLRTGFVVRNQTAIATSKEFDHKALEQRFMRQGTQVGTRLGRGALREGYARRIANAIAAATSQAVTAMRSGDEGTLTVDKTVAPRDLGAAQRNGIAVTDYDPKAIAGDFQSTNAVRRARSAKKYNNGYGRVSGYVVSLDEARKDMPDTDESPILGSLAMSFADQSTSYLVSITSILSRLARTPPTSPTSSAR